MLVKRLENRMMAEGGAAMVTETHVEARQT